MQHLGRAVQIYLDGFPSGPAGLPFFRCLMALLIFVLLDLFSLTCGGVPAGSMSGISLGRGLLSCSLKCYAHHFQCSSWSVSISQLLALTVCLWSLQHFLVFVWCIRFFDIVLACCFLCLSWEVIQKVPLVFCDTFCNLLFWLCSIWSGLLLCWPLFCCNSIPSSPSFWLQSSSVSILARMLSCSQHFLMSPSVGPVTVALLLHGSALPPDVVCTPEGL